jgi:hypothetical protein
MWLAHGQPTGSSPRLKTARWHQSSPGHQSPSADSLWANCSPPGHCMVLPKFNAPGTCAPWRWTKSARYLAKFGYGKILRRYCGACGWSCSDVVLLLDQYLLIVGSIEVIGVSSLFYKWQVKTDNNITVSGILHHSNRQIFSLCAAGASHRLPQ